MATTRLRIIVLLQARKWIVPGNSQLKSAHWFIEAYSIGEKPRRHIMAFSRLQIAHRTLLFALTTLLISSIASPPVAVATALRSPVHYTSPQSIVLRARDLPRSFGGGFIETGSIITNAEVAAVEFVSTATITQHGRITGYQTVLSRQNKSHLMSISDSVGAYRSVAGAHWQYRKFISLFKVPPGATLLSMSGIGDEARAYIGASPAGPFSVSSASVYFRRGKYNARIDIFKLGTLHSSDVLLVARILDTRMKLAR
jgi:hypothetical protein